MNQKHKTKEERSDEPFRAPVSEYDDEDTCEREGLSRGNPGNLKKKFMQSLWFGEERSMVSAF